MAKFCNRQGLGIGEARWRELHEDYDYVHLAEYETDNTLIQAVWHGRVDPRAHEMFWEPFSVLVWTKGSSGQWVEEPSQKNFSDSADAIQFFTEFVTDNFPECYWDDQLNMLVLGNNKAEERIENERRAAAARRDEAEAKKMEKMQKELERQAAIEAENLRIKKEKEREKKLAEELDEIAELATKGDDYGSWS